MTVRAVVIPRARSSLHGFPKHCLFRIDGGRCVLDITRVVEAWDPRRWLWVPEIRLCHLHALEYVTGKPVYLPSFAQQQVDMMDLGA
jgi:hypothetical protein